MASFNKVILVGNLCKDPELKYALSGSAIGKVTLAVNRTWKSDTGEKKEEVTFIDCTAFGRTAEVIGQYCKKGNPLMVEGRLKTESWDDKQTGQKRSRMVVIVESMQLMGSRSDAAGSDSAPPDAAVRPPAAKTTKAPAPADTGDAATPAGDDDVPF